MALLEDKKFNIKTPHASVIVWNYNERGTDSGFNNEQDISETIRLTKSLVSINTSKSKSTPAGTFQFVLAPTDNWVTRITAGSWCAILMSTAPLGELDFTFASKSTLKMIGKIETVRVDVKMNDDGSRATYFTVSGVDWGHMFNNIIYIDNFIASPLAPALGDGASVGIQDMLRKNISELKDFTTTSNLKAIIKLFGKAFPGLSDALGAQGLIVTATYDVSIPRELMTYLKIISPTQTLNNAIKIVSGSLAGPDVFVDKKESYGIINPFALQGQHTFWQVLLEHSNPTLNEMLTEIRWEGGDLIASPSLTLYNRIRPFSLPKLSLDFEVEALKSSFHLLRKVKLETVDVVNLNAGTNWRDKYNFVEIKLDVPNYDFYSIESKKDAQQFDKTAFNREGFRPLITTTKQFPLSLLPIPSIGTKPDLKAIRIWSKLLRDWYFETHRMLNGTITFIGQDDYIGIGENIQFSGSLVNINNNSRSLITKKIPTNEDVLAHVESISHSFSINQESGARSFVTTIQFVRGVFVEPLSGIPNIIAEGGKLDPKEDLLTDSDKDNSNVVKTSTSDDPDK